jgi:carbonic anhydrase
MRLLIVFSYSVSIGLLSTCQAVGADARWSYEGETGPEHWAKLVADNAACAGGNQSPIDLTMPYKANVEDIETAWSAFAPVILNNGHTIQANAADGQITTFGGGAYNLLQVHWHHPSEHTINGAQAPLEAHFVHQNPESGALMVLGVMMIPGEAHEAVQVIWDAAPAEEGEAEVDTAIDCTTMLPENSQVYRYAGSLTTPPCSEIVSWAVFKEPVKVSQEQIDDFAALYPKNNRPLQDQGRRFILVGG